MRGFPLFAISVTDFGPHQEVRKGSTSACQRRLTPFFVGLSSHTAATTQVLKGGVGPVPALLSALFVHGGVSIGATVACSFIVGTIIINSLRQLQHILEI